MSDDKAKEQIDRPERTVEARALKAPDVHSARLSGHDEMRRVEQARTNASDGSLRKLPADWQEQNESIQLIDGEVSISRTNPLREADRARGTARNSNGNPYSVYSAEASQAVERPGPIARALTEGEYQSSIKLNVQITNVPEVSKGVGPEDLVTYAGTVMDAGARAVRPIEEHLSKPNALNKDLWNLPGAAMGGLEHLARSPEQVNKDVQTVVAGVMEQIDKPMKPEHRAELAGQILPLFFFEGGKEPIDSNVAKQMNLEQLTDDELASLGIRRKPDKIADDVVAMSKADDLGESLPSRPKEQQEGITSKSSENLDLPKLRIWRDEFSIQATIPGFPNSRFRAEIPSPGIVHVSDIFTREAPPGTGYKFLAQALKDFGKYPTKELRFTNVLEEATENAFFAGQDASTSKLAQTAARALQALGIEPKAYRWEVVRGKLNLVIDTK